LYREQEAVEANKAIPALKLYSIVYIRAIKLNTSRMKEINILITLHQ
jgi:hypothetical protein